MTKAIYLKNDEDWLGVDQNTEDINFELYEQLKQFLYNYFCNMQEEEEEEQKKWCSSIENALTRNLYTGTQLNRNYNSSSYSDPEFEEVRAIPGGRYGCA